MSITRRATAIMAGLLLLQLFTLSSGTVCALAGSEATTGESHGGGEHAGMVMKHAASGTAGQSTTLRTARDRQQPTPPQSGHSCDGMSMAGSCASMISCASVVTVPVTPSAAVALARAAGVPIEPLSLVTVLAVAPEVPPPRA